MLGYDNPGWFFVGRLIFSMLVVKGFYKPMHNFPRGNDNIQARMHIVNDTYRKCIPLYRV